MELKTILSIAILALLLIYLLRRYFKGSPFEQVEAKVVEVEVSQRVDKKTNQEFTGYVGIYECIINGETYLQRGALSKDPERYHVGDTRTLLYEKANPSNIHLIKRDPKRKKIGVIVIAIGLFVAISALLIKYLG